MTAFVTASSVINVTVVKQRRKPGKLRGLEKKFTRFFGYVKMRLTLQSRFLCVLNSIPGGEDLWGMEVQLQAFVIVGGESFSQLDSAATTLWIEGWESGSSGTDPTENGQIPCRAGNIRFLDRPSHNHFFFYHGARALVALSGILDHTKTHHNR